MPQRNLIVFLSVQHFPDLMKEGNRWQWLVGKVELPVLDALLEDDVPGVSTYEKSLLPVDTLTRLTSQRLSANRVPWSRLSRIWPSVYLKVHHVENTPMINAVARTKTALRLIAAEARTAFLSFTKNGSLFCCVVIQHRHLIRIIIC